MSEIDLNKIDEVVLALLYLTFDEKTFRAWKAMDWAAMDRLHEKGFIGDPKNKNKSIVFTDEGARVAKSLFEKYFSK